MKHKHDKKHVRTSDNIDLKKLKLEGFRMRKRTGLEVTFTLMAAVVIIAIGSTVIISNNSYEAALGSVVLGFCLLLIGMQIEKLKRSVLVSELMNAILSSAVGKDHRFVMVTQTDGSVLFFNRPFQDVFPDFATAQQRTLDELFNLYNASEQRTDLLAAVHQGQEKRVGVIIGTGAEKKQEPISITAEPIARFPEFMLVRGQ